MKISEVFYAIDACEELRLAPGYSSVRYFSDLGLAHAYIESVKSHPETSGYIKAEGIDLAEHEFDEGPTVDVVCRALNYFHADSVEEGDDE